MYAHAQCHKHFFTMWNSISGFDNLQHFLFDVSSYVVVKVSSLINFSGSTEQYRTKKDYTELQRALEGYTGLYSTIRILRTRHDNTGLYRSIRNYTGLYMTIQDNIGQNRTIKDYTGLYRTIWDYTKLYRTIYDYTRLQEEHRILNSLLARLNKTGDRHTHRRTDTHTHRICGILRCLRT